MQSGSASSQSVIYFFASKQVPFTSRQVIGSLKWVKSAFPRERFRTNQEKNQLLCLSLVQSGLTGLYDQLWSLRTVIITFHGQLDHVFIDKFMQKFITGIVKKFTNVYNDYVTEN